MAVDGPDVGVSAVLGSTHCSFPTSLPLLGRSCTTCSAFFYDGRNAPPPSFFSRSALRFLSALIFSEHFAPAALRGSSE